MTPIDRKTKEMRQLDDFRGTWRIERVIRHADGMAARFEGRAVWTQHGADLAYEETGVMRLKGQATVSARQRYTWHPDLTVSFSDGRFFHTVPPDGGETSHVCDPDRYDGHYDFSNWPSFSVTWRVCGPRKDYVSRSTYSRVEG
ncbi:DUF6314 family protein [Sedimentitalea arenosa]|nr:DUF6314 family protein [Arenibacterium arenosum]